MPSGNEVRGLREFRAALKDIDPALPRELAKAHRTIARRGATGAEALAFGLGGVQARAAGAISGAGDQLSARISVNQSGRNPMANVAFWGAKKRTGWFAGGQYASSNSVQHPPWVGDSWEVAEFSTGPYAINRALFFDLPQLVADFDDMIVDLTRRAFPDN